MASLVLINPANHGNKTWSSPPDYMFARMASWVTVVLNEAGKASSAFPLAFSKTAHGWDVVALLGLPGTPNWMVGPRGRWMGRYVPAILRAFPFRLAPVGEERQLAMVIDESSGLVLGEGDGEPFFGADGKPTERTQSYFKLLTEIEHGRRAAVKAVDALEAAAVLKPLSWGGKDENPAAHGQGELFTVDESKLGLLDDAEFLKLRRGGALALAYTQLLSVHHLDTLKYLQKSQNTDAAPAGQRKDMHPAVQAPGLTNDGVLRFN